jgi:hypothetical protein
MTSPWWGAFEPAETRVSCGGGQHLVRWTDGRLEAADHPDAEGELVLAALGGDATPCLDLVQAWGSHSDDLAVLAIGPRSAGDKLTVTPAALEELGVGPAGSLTYPPGVVPASSGRVVARRSGWGASRPSPAAVAALRRQRRSLPAFALITASRGHRGHPLRWAGGNDEPKRAPVLALLALGEPFQWRLSGTVAEAWSAGGRHAADLGRVRPMLTAALAARAAPAAGQWLGIDPERVEVTIHDQDGWGEVSVGARELTVSLPVSWLARVWAPGLALVGGHLVVSVQDAHWPQARVIAMTPGRKPVELTVRSDGREWSVTR